MVNVAPWLVVEMAELVPQARRGKRVCHKPAYLLPGVTRSIWNMWSLASKALAKSALDENDLERAFLLADKRR